MSQDLRTDLSKAKGLGSAKGGMSHWLAQRFTALILLICSAWIILFASAISGKSSTDIVIILQKPQNSIFLMLLIISSFYHAALGMQVVIEDYVSNLCMRYILIFAIKIFACLTVVASIAAIIYLMVL